MLHPRRIYFDNAAACQTDPHILGHYYAYASRFYANQEAAHNLAYNIRLKIDETAAELSQTLCNEKTYVHWGYSGTDLFNLFSGFKGFQKLKIITSPFEHPALNSALKRTGAEIQIVKLKNGQIDLEHFESIIDNETIMTSICQVQSETGLINDLCAIGKIIKKKAPQCIFMSDTIQSAGKINIPWKEAKLDIISLSGHKIGAPGGAALLINPLLEGFTSYLTQCRKEFYTAGRPEPASIFALNWGITLKSKDQIKNLFEIRKINDIIREKLPTLKLFNNKKITVTIDKEKASPYILHFIVPGYQSGVLVRMLSQQNVFFSAGSACQSETNKPSAALSAMGFSKDDAFAGIRLSFSPANTISEAERFIEIFQKTLLEY